jgi:hypothetical protein
VCYSRFKRKTGCASARDLTTECQRCAWRGRSGFSVIHDIECLFSTRYLVITGAASEVRKLSARGAERQVHAGCCISTSENSTSRTLVNKGKKRKRRERLGSMIL